MKVTTADDDARIRFTFRTYAIGMTYGAPPQLVKQAQVDISLMKSHPDWTESLSSADFRNIYIETILKGTN